MLTHYLAQGFGAEEAFRKTLDRLDGAYALGVIFRNQPDRLFAARRGSPLAIGVGNGAMYLASDAIALAPVTNRVCYLEEGDSAVLILDLDYLGHGSLRQQMECLALLFCKHLQQLCEGQFQLTAVTFRHAAPARTATSPGRNTSGSPSTRIRT